MQSLTDTLDRIRRAIKRHGHTLARNEMMTRYALVDPLLAELGWDLSDPAVVVPEDDAEDSGKMDYTLENRSVIVEAKKLDTNLDKYSDQIISYVRKLNARYGVLTNGQKWRMYDASATTKSPKVEFDVTDLDGVVIPEAINLHRLVVSATVGRSQDTPPAKPGERLAVRLDELTYEPGAAPPAQLLDKTGNWKDISSWTGVLAAVAEWLVDKKFITWQDCPVKIGNRSHYLLHVEPVHPNGKKFASHHRIGNIYVNTKHNGTTAIRKAVELVKSVGQEPSDLHVSFRYYGRPENIPSGMARRIWRCCVDELEIDVY